jgi:hypothetical protein
MARDHFRAFARQSVSLTATVMSADGTWHRPARIKNLGIGGACIELMEVVPQGTTLRIQIIAPSMWDPLIVGAEVAWARADPEGRHAQIGVSFEPQSGAVLAQVLELLDSVTP